MRQIITLERDNTKADVELIIDPAKIILSAGDNTITIWLKNGEPWIQIWDSSTQAILFNMPIVTTLDDLPSYLKELDS